MRFGRKHSFDLHNQSYFVGQRRVSQGESVMADILIIGDGPDFPRFVAQTLSAVGHQISEAKGPTRHRF
jgi:hypothetical protein